MNQGCTRHDRKCQYQDSGDRPRGKLRCSYLGISIFSAYEMEAGEGGLHYHKVVTMFSPVQLEDSCFFIIY